MKRYRIVLLFILVILLISGCRRIHQGATELSEIVFMANVDSPSLGTVKPDGSGLNYIKLNERFLMPRGSPDGNTLYGLTKTSAAFIGYPAYWDLESGRFGFCKRGSSYYLQIQGTGDPSNDHEVIIQNLWEIVVLDLNTCEEKIRIVESAIVENGPIYRYNGFSYDYENRQMAYGRVMEFNEGREYDILILDIDTGSERRVATGINPSFSPNRNLIVYIDLESQATLLDIEAGTEEILFKVNPIDFWGSNIPGDLEPIFNWSPDGRYLVYHKCRTDRVSAEYCDIYKYDLLLSEETLVTLNGVFPDWIQTENY